jgi:hypothetical protein
VPAHIARIGDGNIIRTGDSGDSEESYSFNMKSSAAIFGGQNSPVVSTTSGRRKIIHTNKHQTQYIP